MEDHVQTKAELITQVQELRRQVATLEKLENQCQITKQALGISEQQLRTLIDTIPDIVCLKDGEGRWLEANHACITTFDVDKESYNGKTDLELAEGNPFQGVALKFCAASDECAWQARSPITSEEIIAKPDGTNIILDIIKAPVYHDDGRRKGLVVFGRNITERKLTEEVLRRQQRDYKTLIEHTPDLIGRLNRDGKILFVNSATGRVLGVKPKLLMERSIDEFIERKYCHQWYARIEQVFTTGEAITGEGEFIYNTNKYYYHVHYVPEFNSDGEVTSVLTIARDITERKNMEAEMARLDRLHIVGEMAAGIGHEVRNPMTTVRGFLQMLTMKKASLQFKEYYEIMINELDRANAIISEFLSLAKDKVVNKTAIDMNTIIEALLPLLKADGIVDNKYIRADLQPIPLVHADAKEIQQMILNLALNGLEAMTPGGKLTIKTYCEQDEVVLAIQDEGCGIHNDISEKIGTPFFTTKEQGTGLGLAVCYSIANRHDAQVTFTSDAQGTTFFVRFKTYRPTMMEG